MVIFHCLDNYHLGAGSLVKYLAGREEWLIVVSLTLALASEEHNVAVFVNLGASLRY